jgi:hypothetical protein
MAELITVSFDEIREQIKEFANTDYPSGAAERDLPRALRASSPACTGRNTFNLWGIWPYARKLMIEKPKPGVKPGWASWRSLPHPGGAAISHRSNALVWNQIWLYVIRAGPANQTARGSMRQLVLGIALPRYSWGVQLYLAEEVFAAILLIAALLVLQACSATDGASDSPSSQISHKSCKFSPYYEIVTARKIKAHYNPMLQISQSFRKLGDDNRNSH